MRTFCWYGRWLPPDVAYFEFSGTGFFGAADRAIGLQRMLLCAILGLPLGIIVTFGVVQYWPNWALGFGFGVSSPVFYAIGPIWRLRNHEAHEEQIP